MRIEDDLELSVCGEVVIARHTDSARLLDEKNINEPNERFARQFEEFARAIRGLPNYSVLHAEGLRSMRLLDAVKKAALGRGID